MTEYTITYWNGENYWGYDVCGIYDRFVIDCPSLEKAIKIAAKMLEELSYLDHCDLGLTKGTIIYPDTEYFEIDGTTYHVISPGEVYPIQEEE